jgi:diguanylate cyclase (GGDEF)-like protein/PAS domain S-box-containing protein
MGGIQPRRQAGQGIAAAQQRAPAKLRPVRANEAQPSDADRRSGERREEASTSRSVSRSPARHKPHTLPMDWGWMGAVVAASVMVSAFVSNDLPSGAIALVAAFGAVVAWAGGRLARLERELERPDRRIQVLAWIAILVPMATIGFVIGDWSLHGALDWRWACAGLVTATALAASLLSGRVIQQLSSQAACWLPVVALDGQYASFAALALGAICSLLVGRHQLKLAYRRSKRDQERERIRNRAEDILRDYEETGQGWFWETDRRGLLTYISPSAANTLGQSSDALVQRPFIELFDLRADASDGERTLTFHLSSRSSFKELGVRARVIGEDRWWSISGRPAYDSFGNFLGFRGSGTDLTEKKRSEESVHRLAQFDSLTGLANRFQMLQTLEKILLSAVESQRECSVFLLDLDRFKQVNDTLGHPAGDALLKQVAQRLERTVGKEGRVGRLGGDEFKVILPGRVPRERLSQLAQEIIASLSQPYSIEGQRVSIGASIGIAIAPENGDTSEAIIRNSDLALYAAKDGGRGRFHFYSDNLHSAAEERASLEEALRDAIANGSFDLHYQPVVNAADNAIAGFEALLRWNHPVKGWLSPDKFIPVAEEAGLILAIGNWVIRTACADLARWPENVRCAVNVSPLQFSDPQLPSIITNAIASAQISPARLELEITESVFLGDDVGTDAMFTALKRIGVRLALDDFGTGYSSLGYLKRAPFDKIKIDQSFVRGATQPGSRNGAIIASITSLAKSLGMDTTAEGVETLDELELVRNLGCSHVQGYIFSKAVPFDSALGLIIDGPTIRASGFRSARPPRHSVLRKIVLEHEGEFYNGTIRNISGGGAMIEGLWNVPPGTRFNIAIHANMIVRAVAIWSKEQRMGVKFATPLEVDGLGMPKIGSEDDRASIRRAEEDAA